MFWRVWRRTEVGNDFFVTGGSISWKKQEGEKRPVVSHLPVDGGDGNNAGRLISQAEDAHARPNHGTSFLLCGCTPASGQGSAWKPWQGQLLGALPKSEKEKGKGTMRMTPANNRSIAKTGEKMEGQAPVLLGASNNTKRPRV